MVNWSGCREIGRRRRFRVPSIEITPVRLREHIGEHYRNSDRRLSHLNQTKYGSMMNVGAFETIAPAGSLIRNVNQ